MSDDELDELIEELRARLRAEPDPAAAAWLTIDLTDLLAERYGRRLAAGDQAGAAQDLDESADLLTAALARSHPDLDSHATVTLRAGDACDELFAARGQAADRDRAIECYAAALPEAPADLKPILRLSLAKLIAIRSEDHRPGPARDADLAAAAGYARAGLASLPDTPATDPGSPEAGLGAELRLVLGLILDDQFSAAKGWIEAGITGAVAAARGYRDEAIAVLTSLATELPSGDQDAAAVADSLGRLRYERYADPWPEPAGPDREDLDLAVDLLRGAVTAEPDPQALTLLTFALSDRLDLRDDAGDLDDLITWRRRLIELADPADPDTRLDHQLLASELITRAAASPQTWGADLDDAIVHFEAALATIPPGDPDRAETLAGLAHICWDRLDGKSEPYALVDKMTAYADQAWALSSPDDENRDLLGLFLGAGTHERLIRTGAPFDLPAVNRAIEVLTEVEPRFADGQAAPFTTLLLGHFLAARGQVINSRADLAAATPLLLRALEQIDVSDPDNADSAQTLAVGMTVLAEQGIDADRIDQAIALLITVTGRPDPDLVRAAMARGALGLLLVQRAGFTASERDLDEGISHLRASYEMAPAGDAYRAAASANIPAALLTRFFARGQAEDLAAARFYLDTAETLAGPARDELRSLMADFDLVIMTNKGMIATAGSMVGDVSAMDEGVASLRTALASLPPGHRHAERIRSDLGVALALRAGSSRSRLSDLAEATDLVTGTVAGLAGSQTVGPLALLRAGGILAAAGVSAGDQNQLRQAIGRLTEALGQIHPRFGNRFRFVALAGMASLHLYQLTGDVSDLERAIGWLEECRRDLDRRAFHPQYANCLMGLARAYRARGDAGRAHQAGLAALGARARELLLQTGTARSLGLARAAAAEASQVAAWCFADGRLGAAVEAVELGRGLVLHASTSVTGFADLLADAGHGDLAREWRTAASVRRDTPWDTGVAGPAHLTELIDGTTGLDVPDDLRARALAALAGSPAEQHLLAPPTAADVADALAETGADALVYLLGPADGKPGRAVVLPAVGPGRMAEISLRALNEGTDGPLAGYAAAYAATLAPPGEDPPPGASSRWQSALGDVCDWAWHAVMQPLGALIADWELGRPPRLVLVPAGELSQVPWHAARYQPDGPGSVRYALQDMVISYAASGRQLAEVAARPAMPLESSPVVVSAPGSDLHGVKIEAQAIVTGVYPAARYLGDEAAGWDRAADGPGTPDEVLGYLPACGRPGASVLHFGCHGHVSGSEPGRSHLSLAGSADLTVEAILRQAGGRPAEASGGLVSLAACSSDVAAAEYDEALTLATAFLAAGAVTVVGARWNVPDRHTSLLMFMFHHLMARHGLTPRDALRDAQLWMLDPNRVPPPEMPAALAERAGGTRSAQLTAWAAFVHQGQ